MQVKDSNRNRRDFRRWLPSVSCSGGCRAQHRAWQWACQLRRSCLPVHRLAAVWWSHGVFCGFLAGLVFDLSTTGPIGLMAFCSRSARLSWESRRETA